MFAGRSRGPKPSRWTKGSRASFESFFAKRSEPLSEAATVEVDVEAACLGLKWLFAGFGEGEPLQVSAPVGAPVRSIALGVTGALLALGFGDSPGSGTCERFWVVD